MALPQQMGLLDLKGIEVFVSKHKLQKEVQIPAMR